MKNILQKTSPLWILFSSIVSASSTSSFFDERVEKSPVIQKILVEYQVPYIEVFAWGDTPLECYNNKQVDIRIENDSTYIIPRYIFSPSDKNCVDAKAQFEKEKIADLDPSNPASYKVAVLGHTGWIWYELDKGSKKP